MKWNDKGFTLFEVFVVFLLMAVLAGISTLSADFVRRARLANASAELVADLQRARLYSMTREGKGFGIRLASDRSYVIFRFNDCDDDYFYDANTCGGAREEDVLTEKKLPDSVIMTKTNPVKEVENDVLVFNRFGTPHRPSGSMGLITIVLKSRPDTGLIKCVVVSENRIREGIWAKSTCKS